MMAWVYDHWLAAVFVLWLALCAAFVWSLYQHTKDAPSEDYDD